MLQTNLVHIASKEELKSTVINNQKVMICCGRMGPMCIPVYRIMEELQNFYTDVVFRDMDFGNKDAQIIRNFPECSYFTSLPITVYFKNGKLVKATGGIQKKEEIQKILNEVFI